MIVTIFGDSTNIQIQKLIKRSYVELVDISDKIVKVDIDLAPSQICEVLDEELGIDVVKIEGAI